MDRPLVILGYGLRLRSLTLSFAANDHEQQESKEKDKNNCRQYWILFP